MSTPQLIPVFDPQGELRDVPEDQVAAAVKAGGVPSVRFKDPQGNIRFVPANRTQEAVRAGGQILPLEQQDINHEGGWKALGGDLWNAVKATPQLLTQFSSDPATMARNLEASAKRNQGMVENSEQEKAEGHGLPYRVGSVAAQTAGVNVPGMEESARQGDVGGVYGHAAAVPVTMGIAKGLGELAPRGIRAIGESPAGSAPIRLAARSAETAINQNLVPARPLFNLMTPADEATATAVKVPGRDFGLRAPFRNPGGPLPEEPPAAVMQARGLQQGGQPVTEPSSALTRVATPHATPEASMRELPRALDATAENKPFAGGLDEPPPPRVARPLDATPENRPFAGGMDEYTPPKGRTPLDRLQNTGKIPSPSETAQNIRAYRARSIGEEGIPYRSESPAQATTSQPQAESYLGPREEQTGEPQELIGVDLSQSPAFSARPGPGGANWYKFHGDVPESAVTRIARPGASAAPPIAEPAQIPQDIARPAETGQASDPTLERLRAHAERIQQAEARTPEPDEDLTPLLTESVARAKAMRGLGEQ